MIKNDKKHSFPLEIKVFSTGNEGVKLK